MNPAALLLFFPGIGGVYAARDVGKDCVVGMYVAYDVVTGERCESLVATLQRSSATILLGRHDGDAAVDGWHTTQATICGEHLKSSEARGQHRESDDVMGLKEVRVLRGRRSTSATSGQRESADSVISQRTHSSVIGGPETCD